MLGTNDAWHRLGEPEQVEAGLAQLLLELRERRGGRMVLVQPPGWLPKVRAKLERHVYPAVRRLARARDVRLVEPVLGAGAYRQDLVHLSSEGGEKIARAVAEAIS